MDDMWFLLCPYLESLCKVRKTFLACKEIREKFFIFLKNTENHGHNAIKTWREVANVAWFVLYAVFLV